MTLIVLLGTVVVVIVRYITVHHTSLEQIQLSVENKITI